jgi:(S)-ureidoglycine-glyoxylate aminotransferase
MVAMIHGETSTGVLQPLGEIARLARAHEALLMADAVVTLGGCAVETDTWGVDVMVAGTQKCLSCPSGLAPVTYNARAEAVLTARKTRPRSNYLDLGQLAQYWSPQRFNHHTAPTTMVYGLREALRAIQEEGLVARFARHRLHGDALRAGLTAMGLALFGAEPPERRLPFITPVVVPDGVDELRVRGRLIEDFNLEIGAAFGPLQGRVAHRHHVPPRSAETCCSAGRARAGAAPRGVEGRGRCRRGRGGGPLRGGGRTRRWLHAIDLILAGRI